MIIHIRMGRIWSRAESARLRCSLTSQPTGTAASQIAQTEAISWAALGCREFAVRAYCRIPAIPEP